MPWDRYLPLRESQLKESGYITHPYVIDAHSHLHLHVPHAGQPPFQDFYEVSDQLHDPAKAGFIPTETLLQEMDRYGIDISVIHCAMYVPLKELAARIRAHPNRLIGFCWYVRHTSKQPTPEEAAEEIDNALRMPEFKGCGEPPVPMTPQAVRNIEPIMEVVAKHRVPMLFHTGPVPYGVKITKETRKRAIKTGYLRTISDPLVVGGLARLYPEIPFIVGHMGVQGSFFFGSYADRALMTAAMNPNVFLETSMAPPEVIAKAVADPAIGAEKLIFGSDFGATSGYYVYNGHVYPSYKKRPHPEQTGYHIKRALDVLNEVPMPEEERRLILGQNIARLLHLD